MTIELIMDLPASGKTTVCLQKIRQIKSDDPLASVQVLVPDSLQLQAFQKRLASPSGSWGIRVNTFAQFARSILEKALSGKIIINPSLNRQIVCEAIRHIQAKGKLNYYCNVWNTAGFSKVVTKAFSDFEKNCISADQMKSIVQTQQEIEINLIFEEYQIFLSDHGWVSPSGVIQAAAEIIKKKPDHLDPFRLLIIDGFDNFDQDQLWLIRNLEPITDEIYLTLPGSLQAEEKERLVNRRFSRSLEQIQKVLNIQIAENTVKSAIHLPDILRYIVENIFKQQPVKWIETNPSDEKSLILLEAGTQEDEVREVLRQMKSWIIRDAIPIASCAIFAPQLEKYAPALRRISEEMQIPLNFGRKVSLIESPVVITLFSLLRLQPEGLKTNNLMNCLRFPYISSGLTPEQVNWLDFISRQLSITGGSEQWEEAWNILQKEDATEKVDDEDGNQFLDYSCFPDSAELLLLKNGLQAFLDNITPPQGNQQIPVWIAWLKGVCEKIQLRSHIRQEEESDYFALTACFEELIIEDRMVPRQNIDYNDFLSALTETITASERSNPTQQFANSIFTGEITWARGIRFQAAAFLGFGESIFPSAVAEDVIIKKEFQDLLQIPVSADNDQSGLLIQILSRADEKLLISRPCITDAGDEWEESLYWNAIRQIVPENTVQRIRSSTKRPLSEAASEDEKEYWAVLQRKRDEYADDDNNQDMLEASQRDPMLEGLLSSGACDSCVNLPEQFRSQQIFSSSQLENGLYCPFRYFISNILFLEPIKEPAFELDTKQLGSLLHRILQLTFEKAENLTDKTFLLEQLEKACNCTFPKAPIIYQFRPSGLWIFQQNQLKKQLMQTIEKLSEISEGWLMVAAESAFGIRGKPFLKIDIEGISLNFRGIIDRIDRNRNGNLRIIDYKIGGTHFSADDVFSGRRVQLFLYALAAADALKIGRIEEGFYWAILSAKASSLKLSGFMDPQEMDRTATFRALIMEKIKQFYQILEVGEFPANPIDGKCPSYCSAATWCALFQREDRP
ncbi:PD-(D/E)XK nuclease family protein [Flexilinea flocculi]|uniref:ATP-dependent helicase/DNAse subunit B n=1 Tax=Flexilinea flocculi TaxID=1678840 RepID=A0A0K8PAR3_9CHLR|nr:PD-(D/E)XK nuclease family protein [Flexilinea flocculi]GAP39731.1 ATP-dependent helicase/DNAse subunit B [Flexilinea flocculi]